MIIYENDEDDNKVTLYKLDELHELRKNIEKDLLMT